MRSTLQTGNADSSFAATVCSLALPHPTPHTPLKGRKTLDEAKKKCLVQVPDARAQLAGVGTARGQVRLSEEVGTQMDNPQSVSHCSAKITRVRGGELSEHTLS